DGMRRLARDLRSVSLALRNKDPEILEVERVQREKLKHAAGGSE
ncbi:MAG: N-acetylneuraminate synthase, partial [Phycisphaeraceae bacterium]|nr:N-acetylneuraminate synthase [Phycisphaeraceae bacterium]